MLSEQAWINKVSCNDLESFNQFVLKYQTLVYRHACAILGDPDRAEDVVQESFIKAFENMGRFRGGSSQAWLLKIVSNTAWDHWRQILRHPSVVLIDEMESSSWLADSRASVETTVQRKEESARLNQMLDELPVVYRSVLTLVDVDEMDYAETAETLGVPVGTVKSRLSRARLQMRKKLQGRLPIPRLLTSLLVRVEQSRKEFL